MKDKIPTPDEVSIPEMAPYRPKPRKDWIEPRLTPEREMELKGLREAQGRIHPERSPSTAPGSNYYCCGECRPWWCERCQAYHCAWFEPKCPREQAREPST